jgi:hypothetical protein
MSCSLFYGTVPALTGIVGETHENAWSELSDESTDHFYLWCYIFHNQFTVNVLHTIFTEPILRSHGTRTTGLETSVVP